MRKILFWFEDDWAFGTIHHALCKELYKYGIYANLLNWSRQLTAEEIKLLVDVYDLFVTKPDTAMILHLYGIPLEKIAAVSHAQWDYLVRQKEDGIEYYSRLYKFGAVSNILKQKAAEFGIKIIPEVLTMGIHFDLFYSKPTEKLISVGYAGAKQVSNFFGQEIKRGKLVEQIINNNSFLKLIQHKRYIWMAMPAYYNLIDSIVVSSTEEGAGLPSLEAAAAGRLVFSTPVGYFEEHGPKGGGVVLPIEQPAFEESLINSLIYYYNDSEAYRKKCLDIQEYARENYDWSKHIESWVSFLM